MEHGSGSTKSLWMELGPPAPSTPVPDGDLTAQVCVVGAGIAGLTTAYLLCREGQSVVVLDDGPITMGESARTTAHLSNAIDDRYTEMIRWHGLEGARLAADSHTAAIDTIERIVREEGIDCDFRRLDGYLIPASSDDRELIRQEHQAAHKAGLTDTTLTHLKLRGMEYERVLRFPNQGQFHPLKYMRGLAAAIERMGGRIATGLHVTRVHDSEPVRVETAQGPVVLAEAAVVATNTPINDHYVMHSKQAPYRTYVIACRIPTGSVPTALYWDTLEMYHYVRIQPAEDGTHDWLIVGGEDHKTGQANDMAQRFDRLEAWAREHFPMIEGVGHRWSGQVMETDDGLAYIGHNPMDEDDIYIATGDSGMGMTHGTIAGLLLTDLILGRDNPWEELYDPRRKPLAAGSLREFAAENLNVARRYTDYVTGGDVRSLDEIRPGTGAVLRDGMRKLAVYRDEQGQLHRLSAVCTHLKCIVQWNGLERTWDCPCHGSRYDAYGNLLNGPAHHPLHKAD